MHIISLCECLFVRFVLSIKISRFKHGGGTKASMRHLEKKLTDYPSESDALLNDVEDFQIELQQRKEIVFAQALSTCITAFITNLLVWGSHSFSSSSSSSSFVVVVVGCVD
jgi:hypothetical protein